MDTSEFDKELERLESEKERLSKEAEDIAQRFTALIQERLVVWAPTFIESTVKSETEVTKNLGVERLRVLKAEMQGIVNKLPQAAKEAFDKEQYWPLRVRTRTSQEESNVFHQVFATVRNYSQKVPRHIKRAHDEAQKPVIDFLKQYGYQAHIYESHPRQDVVLFNDYEFTKKAVEVLVQYSNLYDSRWRVIHDIEETRRKKELSEAKSLWDEA